MTFQVGQINNFPVTTTPGSLAATTLGISGILPAGLTLIDNKNGTGKLGGTPAAGTYHFTIVGSNAVAKTTMGITLTVNQAPGFTSASSAVFTMGQNGTFTIKTKGFPTASLTHGPLPAGLSFVDNGNGTATLSGAATNAGVLNISLTADNGILPAATQNFRLTVKQPPTFTSRREFHHGGRPDQHVQLHDVARQPAATTLTLTEHYPRASRSRTTRTARKMTGKPAAAKEASIISPSPQATPPRQIHAGVTLTVNQRRPSPAPRRRSVL